MTMAKKSGLTFERHKEIAAELKDIRRRLQRLEIEFGNSYARSGDVGMPYKRLYQALKAVDGARSWAEENLFREHPAQADIHIYYPADWDG